MKNPYSLSRKYFDMIVLKDIVSPYCITDLPTQMEIKPLRCCAVFYKIIMFEIFEEGEAFQVEIEDLFRFGAIHDSRLELPEEIGIELQDEVDFVGVEDLLAVHIDFVVDDREEVDEVHRGLLGDLQEEALVIDEKVEFLESIVQFS